MLSSLKSVVSTGLAIKNIANAALHPVEYAKEKIVELVVAACVPVLKKALTDSVVTSIKRSASKSKELAFEMQVHPKVQTCLSDPVFVKNVNEALNRAFDLILNPLGLYSASIVLTYTEVLRIEVTIRLASALTKKL